jgi:tetratricopeptide (TPR) repeat protein
METDPNNPVVRLCAEGINSEMAGKADEATRLYQEAWEARTDDYEACIAAHYLARVQRTPNEVLNWNRESLRYADAVNDERVEGFYPSLYLNMGKAYEDLGKREEARKFYGLAEGKAITLPEGKYGDVVRHGVAEGLKRVAE